MFCYILFLLDCFISVILSKVITVDVKRKAIGRPDLVSTLLVLKLPEKGKLTTVVHNKRQSATMSNTLCTLQHSG